MPLLFAHASLLIFYPEECGYLVIFPCYVTSHAKMVSYSLEKLGCPILSFEGQAVQRLGMKAIFNGRMSTYRYTKAWGQRSVQYFTYSNFLDISLKFLLRSSTSWWEELCTYQCQVGTLPHGARDGIRCSPCLLHVGGGGVPVDNDKCITSHWIGEAAIPCSYLQSCKSASQVSLSIFTKIRPPSQVPL